MRIGVDTNIIVRLIVDDGSAQVQAVVRLAGSHHLVVVPSAILETEWVLRRVLGLSRGEILAGFRKLLGFRNATFLHRGLIEVAMRAFEAGCDFADALHAASTRGIDVFSTFDRDFVRQAKRLDYLPPVQLVTGILATDL